MKCEVIIIGSEAYEQLKNELTEIISTAVSEAIQKHLNKNND